uniref:rRNA methyltransferase 2, mitochondrial n=1 Tax=Plectus sambesii TaxID=2011161 RepID=A0A914ULY9_9BILA
MNSSTYGHNQHRDQHDPTEDCSTNTPDIVRIWCYATFVANVAGLIPCLFQLVVLVSHNASLAKLHNKIHSTLRHEHNYRARSAFKLIEIDDKFRLLRPGSVVVELGAAPGAWSQVVVERASCLSQVKDQPVGFVLGVDLQPIAPLSGAEFISMGDITLKETQDAIRQRLDDRLVDLVLSDMAPNPTGSAPTDHIRIVKLCAIALRLAVAGDVVRLKQEGGAFVCKLWGGVDTDELVAATRKYFTKVNIYKPPASRDDSSELFIVAKNFIGIQNE